MVQTHLFGEVLNDAVFRHLGADGEASLQLLFYARDHLLILLGCKSLHTYMHQKNVTYKCAQTFTEIFKCQLIQ